MARKKNSSKSSIWQKLKVNAPIVSILLIVIVFISDKVILYGGEVNEHIANMELARDELKLMLNYINFLKENKGNISTSITSSRFQYLNIERAVLDTRLTDAKIRIQLSLIHNALLQYNQLFLFMNSPEFALIDKNSLEYRKISFMEDLLNEAERVTYRTNFVIVQLDEYIRCMKIFGRLNMSWLCSTSTIEINETGIVATENFFRF